MVERRVRVFVEGGASGKQADNDFRRGWKKFLDELHRLARANGYQSLEVVRGKGRADTFRKFKSSRETYPHDLCVLLVDSEGPVAPKQGVWDVVANRRGDQWIKPPWAGGRHLYLIVQFIETWLVADPDALRSFFKGGFAPEKLPTTNLEQQSKSKIEQALKAATRSTAKGAYRHVDATLIMEKVRPEKVKTLSHGRRLFSNLSDMIQDKEVTETEDFAM